MHLLPTPSPHLAGIIRPAVVLKHDNTGVVVQHDYMLSVARPIDLTFSRAAATVGVLHGNGCMLYVAWP